MPLYRYEALDKTGQLRRGVMDAPSEDQVRQRLIQMGFAPRAVAGPDGKPQAKAHPTAAGIAAGVVAGVAAGVAAVAAPATSVSAFSTSSLPLAEQTLFWRQLAELASAGLTPYDMFQAIGARARNGRVRRAALDIAGRVQAGASVADAMSFHGDIFGTEHRLAIMAGEMGGFAHEIYGLIANTLDDEKLSRERWKWFRYFYNINLAGAIPCAFFVYVMGHHLARQGDMSNFTTEQYRAMLMQGVTLWAHLFFYRALPLLAGGYLAYRVTLYWAEYGWLRAVGERVVWWTPLVRGYKQRRMMSRFFTMLRRLVAGGVPPVSAWDAASESVGNSQFAARLLTGRTALASGQGFSAAMERTGLFPHSNIELMYTGDRAGRVPEMLGQLERAYMTAAESRSKSVRLCVYLPAAIVSGALVVYGVVVAISTYFKLMFQVAGVN